MKILTPVLEVSSIYLVVLAYPEVSTNGGRVTFMVVLPFTSGFVPSLTIASDNCFEQDTENFN